MFTYSCYIALSCRQVYQSMDHSDRKDSYNTLKGRISFKKKLVKMKMSILLHAIFLCTTNGIFMLTGIFLNSIVILCFWRSSKLRNRLDYFMIVVLACFDLAAVIVTHPLIMLSTMAWRFQKYEIFHRINPDISRIFYALSLSSLLTMNIERYVALTYPFFHQRFVTRWRVLTLFSAFEVLCVVQYILCYRGLVLPTEVAPASLLAVQFFLSFFLNYKVFMIARRMRKVDHRIAASLQLNQGNNPPVHIFTLRRRATLKGISSCLYAVLCFFVCYFPALLRLCISLASKSLLSLDVGLGWTLWASTLASMNSAFNCLIFFWKNTTLRNEGRNILKNWGMFLIRSNDVDER